MSIDKELLDILVCPLSKAALVLDGDTLVSTDKKTRKRYKVDDGIPNMLIERKPKSWPWRTGRGSWRNTERHDLGRRSPL